MNSTAPDIAFFGICERGIELINGRIPSYNILGLKSVFLSHLFPINIEGFTVVFAIYDGRNFRSAQIKIYSPTSELLFTLDLGLTPYYGDITTTAPADILPVPAEFPIWTIILHKIDVPILITQQGLHKVTLLRDNEETPIGWLHFAHVPASPLTPDRISAIRSKPTAWKAARFTVACRICHDEIRTYTALDRKSENEQAGWLWYEELPETFKCRCGKTNLDLTIMRDNLHGLLGNTTGITGQVSFTKLYEKNVLEAVCSDFLSLLDKNPPEDDIQKFIQNNPILLYPFFSPERIFFKPPILAKYKTDIVILNPKKELLLIELEKPGTPLLKRTGGIKSELQHAMDQVRDWLYEIEQHRAAVFDALDLKIGDVSTVHTIVIAGRDRGCDPKHLQKLKWADFGRRITFYTYDDLLGGLVNLVRKLDAL